jgi:hypothetical protein
MQQLQDQQQPRLKAEQVAFALNDVLENILCCLPQTFRLRVCSLVCTRWRAAALCATAQVGLVATWSPVCLISCGRGCKSMVLR